jgi:hypothetical protein
MNSQTIIEKQAQTAVHTRLVEVSVNERPVNVNGPRVSGLEIKQAAIAQSVPIQLDFVLSEELPNGRSRVVGDDDIITINKQSQFLAIPNDDNS